MEHLTHESLRRLLGGTLPGEEARRLALHLAAECATCEEFLASRPEADAVDGLVEAALAAAGSPGRPGNDLEFARIERQLAKRARSPRRIRLAGALAAAALLAGAGGLLLARAPQRSPWDGEKGSAPAPAVVRLRFLVLEPEGREPGIEKGIPGQALPGTASLQFEIEVSRAAEVAVLRVGDRAAPDLLFRGRMAAGRTLLSTGGRPAAYALAGDTGRQRFAAVASDEPLGRERLARAAAALAAAGRAAPDAPGLEGLWVDVVEVEVR